MELLRSSIPSTINNDVIIEESLSKEYDTIENARTQGRLDENYGTIGNTGSKVNLRSVDRTFESVGYEAVNPIQSRMNTNHKDSNEDLDDLGTPKPGLSAAISDCRKQDEDGQSMSKSFQNRLLSTVKDETEAIERIPPIQMPPAGFSQV